VLFIINKELMIYEEAAEQAKYFEQFQKSRMDDLKKRLKNLCLKKKQKENTCNILYEKYALGKIEREEYHMTIDETSEEIVSLSKQIKACQEKINLFIHYLHFEKLTQELVDSFIKKIYVYKGKRVEIEWKFKNHIL